LRFVSQGTILAPQSFVFGAIIIVGCVAACGAIGRILLALYGPHRKVRAPRSSRSLIIEPLFVARKPPTRPRNRLARGTGEVVQSVIDAEATEKVVRLEMR
jgi:hypothetical protein